MSTYTDRFNEWMGAKDSLVISTALFLLRSEDYIEDEFTPIVEAIIKNNSSFKSDKQKAVVARHLAFHLKDEE